MKELIHIPWLLIPVSLLLSLASDIKCSLLLKLPLAPLNRAEYQKILLQHRYFNEVPAASKTIFESVLGVSNFGKTTSFLALRPPVDLRFPTFAFVAFLALDAAFRRFVFPRPRFALAFLPARLRVAVADFLVLRRLRVFGFTAFAVFAVFARVVFLAEATRFVLPRVPTLRLVARLAVRTLGFLPAFFLAGITLPPLI